MQSTSSDSSIWRSLAVAFGDGLAFGVGMTLSQKTGRPGGAAPQSGARELAERVGQLEQQIRRIERSPMAAAGALDQKVLEAIVNAVEARIQEHSGQVERRLADLEAGIAMQMKSLDQQDQDVAKRVGQDIAALQGQVVTLNREFSEAVGRIVAEQVARQAAALEGGLDERIAARTASLDGLEGRIAARLETAVGAAVAARTASLDGLDERITERVEARTAARMETAERSLQELLAGIGEMCRKAAERMAPASAGGSAETGAPPPRAAVEEPEENPVPGFAQGQATNRPWRVPLVSSFVAAAGALLLLQFH